MKRLLIALFIFLFSLGCLAEKIEINGNAIKQPKIWQEEGIARGALVDIMHHIGQKMGHQFEHNLFPWKRAYRRSETGLGGIVGISITEERLKIFDYSDPLYYDEVILVVQKGNEFKFEHFEDLQGKIIGVCRGCAFGREYVKARKFFTPDEDNNSLQRLKKLKAGRIDAAIISPGEAALNLEIAKTNSLSRDDFSILPKPIARDPNYLAFSKKLNRKGFLAAFNKSLKEAFESGEITRIVNRY